MASFLSCVRTSVRARDVPYGPQTCSLKVLDALTERCGLSTVGMRASWACAASDNGTALLAGYTMPEPVLAEDALMAASSSSMLS